MAKKTLKQLLSKKYILEMTKNCIIIEEEYDIINDEIYNANKKLWSYLCDLAEAQGIELPEYTGP